jgi:hypothetical protein
MPKTDEVPPLKTKQKILVYGVLNCAAYIILFMSFRYFNLLHFSGLRMLNYVSLFLISLYQINRWVKQIGTYIPSLQAFGAIFFTGSLSFMLFAGFIFAYSLFDPYLTESYFNTYGKLHSWSALLIFFEGVAGSVIIAMVAMMYSDRYEDGEAKI